MSDTETIDTGAEVTIPTDGEVSREELIKLIEDGMSADSETAGEDGAADTPAEAGAVNPSPAASEPAAVDPKVSARILAATKAERRLIEQREATARERAALETDRAAVAEQAKAVEALKAAKLSPSKALELLGMTPKEFLESLATENEPTAIAQRAVSATQTETQRLAAELESVKKLLTDRDRAQYESAKQAAQHEAQSGFIEHVASRANEYPFLTEEFTPEEIAQRGWEMAVKHGKAYQQRFGEPPSDDVIADHLESEAKARAEKRAAWRERIGKTAPHPSQGSAIQGQPVKANTPRTLTSNVTAQKAGAPKPWSQEDADAESRRLVRQMFSPSE